MSKSVVEVEGLRKSYGELEAVRGVDLRVDRGEIFALLGPNGAGKTTTVEILEGHRSRSAGDVRVLGYDPERNEIALKERIGIVLQRTGLEPYLTVAETIDLFRGYYPRPLPRTEILALVGLEEHRDQRVRRLSGGLQRRLDVAVGLAGDPELLFLDEPTTGFDPMARQGAWAMICALRGLGKTIVLTTHYLDEAQALADRVAIMVRGEIIAEDTPARLIGADETTVVRFRIPDGVALPPALALTEAQDESWAELRTVTPTRDLHALTSWAMEAGIDLDELTASRPSLEEVYLQLVAADPGSEPSSLRLALRQVKYEQRAFLRNPAAAFFTLAFPLIFLVILNVIFGDDDLDLGGRVISGATFYVPAIMALTVVNSCYTGLAMGFAINRDEGVLKRVRGAPLPSWAFLFGRIAHTTLVMVVLAAIVIAFGWVFYDVELPTTALPAVLVTLALGALAFSALGLAMAALIPNADAAPAVVNASILPLLFISDVFIPPDADTPGWVQRIGDLFPVKHLSEALQAGFNPFATGSGFEWSHLGVVALWGVVGAIVAVRFSSWEPRN